jgi:hypothetical protein
MRALKHADGRPLDYNQRQALLKQRTPVQQETPRVPATSAWDEIQQLAKSSTIEQVMHERPDLAIRHRKEVLAKQGPARATDMSSPALTVSHPPGIKKAVDGTPASWDEQVKYWKDHPEERSRYLKRFRT